MDIVYEWEDIFRDMLALDFSFDNTKRKNKRVLKIPYLSNLFTTWDNAIKFDLYIGDTAGMNKKNISPIIIDFYANDKSLEMFFRCYRRHKLVIVSSFEVYHYLKSHNCPFNIAHLPLSIPDKYRISKDSFHEKKYDLILMGRQNNMLMQFLNNYKMRNVDFSYVYVKQENGHFRYYTSEGQYVGDADTRSKYIDMMRKARVGFWSTPGMDGGEQYTNGFNQVTPRFLEYIACGCHIVARYPQNEDTMYYNIGTITPSIESYDEFESFLNKAINTPVDYEKYANYLSNHYTSNRVLQLEQIIREL